MIRDIYMLAISLHNLLLAVMGQAFSYYVGGLLGGKQSIGCPGCSDDGASGKEKVRYLHFCIENKNDNTMLTL